MMEYYVEIVRFKGMKVAKRMGPMSESKAEKVDRGASINMSGDYFTRIVPANGEKDGAK